MTLHPRARAQVGSGLGLKRPERRRRRWRLGFCSWINEESYPLGMRQAISRPPSKPVHPRETSIIADPTSIGAIRGRARREGPSARPRVHWPLMLGPCRPCTRPPAAPDTPRATPGFAGFVLAVLVLIATVAAGRHGLARGARERTATAREAEFHASTRGNRRAAAAAARQLRADDPRWRGPVRQRRAAHVRANGRPTSTD